MKDHELEVKFFVRDLPSLEGRLVSVGAQLIQPRTYEQNLRFDTPDRELGRSFQVLRLRRDVHARMTYKGPAETIDGVRVRKEIEFIVEDFQAAWQLLLALGYQVMMTYEKYRTVYDMHGVYVSLDELPYGYFIEIEGPDPATIHEVNFMLGLNWEARVPESYTVLFEQLQTRLGLDFKDLIFKNFQDLQISAQDLKVLPAD